MMIIIKLALYRNPVIREEQMLQAKAVDMPSGAELAGFDSVVVVIDVVVVDVDDVVVVLVDDCS